jgi:hypothetical protein
MHFRAPGAASVTAYAGTASARINLTVLPIAALTSVEIDLLPRNGVTGCVQQLGVTLRSDNQLVFGPRCAWSGVRIMAWTALPWSDSGGWPGDHPQQLYIAMGSQGTHVARCKVGPASTTVMFDHEPGSP